MQRRDWEVCYEVVVEVSTGGEVFSAGGEREAASLRLESTAVGYRLGCTGGMLSPQEGRDEIWHVSNDHHQASSIYIL